MEKDNILYAMRVTDLLTNNKFKIYKTFYRNLEDCLVDNIYSVSKGYSFNRIYLKVDRKDLEDPLVPIFFGYEKLYGRNLDVPDDLLISYKGFLYSKDIEKIETVNLDEELDKNSFLYFRYKQELLNNKKGRF